MLQNKPRLAKFGIVSALACLCLLAVLASLDGGPSRVAWGLARLQGWEPTIREFEQHDKAHPPKPGVIVFTGSSSITYWDNLASDMKPLYVINRGFGGSEFSDVNEYAKRIVVA